MVNILSLSFFPLYNFFFRGISRRRKKMMLRIDNYLSYHRYRTTFFSLLIFYVQRVSSPNEEMSERKRERRKRLRLFFRIIKCTTTNMRARQSISSFLNIL